MPDHPIVFLVLRLPTHFGITGMISCLHGRECRLCESEQT
eukprot:COSAG02_NODE_298_length_25350_cov_48.266999_19_plen_40_part_00